MASKAAELLLKIKTMGEENLSKVGSLISEIGKIGAVAFGALTAIATKAISAFKEQEDATRALTQSMINNGVYSKALLDDYSAQAKALQKLTTYGDEQIMSAQASLQQQIGSQKITKDLTKSILDFATAQKMDLASAAEVVGKSIGTTTNALGRYGIEISATASQSEKTALAIAGLNKKFGGQAEAAAQGLGSIEQLKVAVGDLFEDLGERLAPVITIVSQALTAFASDSNNTGMILDGLANTFKFLITVSTYLVSGFQALADSIGIGLAVAVEATSAAVQLNFSKVKDIMAQGGAELTAAAEARGEQLNNNLLMIDKAYQDQKEKQDEDETNKLVTTLQRRSDLKQTQIIADRTKELEQSTTARELQVQLDDINHQEDMAKLTTNEEEKNIAIATAEEARLTALIGFYDKRIATATTAQQKLALMETKANLEKDLRDQTNAKNRLEFEKKVDEQRIANRKDTFSTIATMSNSNNSVLSGIGKAFAISQIAMDTPVAIAKALASAPPPFNFGLAALVGAAMASQAANIAGVQLAQGGVVMPRSGGTQATIGEAGSAEAVIPLDKFPNLLSGGGSGGSITLNVYGGLLGDQSSAYEFAKAVDRELLKLRQNNESHAFDSGVV